MRELKQIIDKKKNGKEFIMHTPNESILILDEEY